MFDPGVRLLNTVPGSDFNKLLDTSANTSTNPLQSWLLIVSCYLFDVSMHAGPAIGHRSWLILAIQLYKLQPTEVFNRKNWASYSSRNWRLTRYIGHQDGPDILMWLSWSYVCPVSSVLWSIFIFKIIPKIPETSHYADTLS